MALLPCAGQGTAGLPTLRRGSLLREGEGLAGLGICTLQTTSKRLNTQFPGNFSKEGQSTLLFLIPGLERMGQGLSLVLFQPDIKTLNDLPPARLCRNAAVGSSESTTATSS